MEKVRVHWVDIARGVLILMVVFFHLPILTDALAVNKDYVSIFSKASEWYLPFFIPAFFVLSGMCSNFTMNWKTFLIKNCKSLLLPMVTLSFLVRLIGWSNHDWHDYLSIDSWSYAVVGYFMLSLLIARFLYWLLVHLVNHSLLRGGICVILIILGIALNSMKVYNIMFFQNALIFVFFLVVGRLS